MSSPAIASDGAELRRRFDAQREAFRLRAPGYRERVDALRRLEKALLARKADIIQAIDEDFGGRAAEETVALELFPVLNEIRYAIQRLKHWMAPRHASVGWQFWPARARVVYQPRGVVGILSAWNYPLFLSLAPLAGALAAGNHVMLKPSELAPRKAELIRSMIAELYGPEYVTVVVGDSRVASEFASLPFDHLLFTGSARIGKLVMKAASENLTPVTLELGGKSPALVSDEYPVRKAAERILTGKLYNAGQTCVAPDYALVPRERMSDFVTAARDTVGAMYPKLVQNADYTRIISVPHYRRLRGLVDSARQAGAEVVEINPAAEVCNEENRVFPPTLLLNTPQDLGVMQEEVFGPVLPIVPYGGLDEAIAYINARPHPLALYYFDENGRRVQDVLARTTAGGATVNDCIFHVGQPCLPFGGVGDSGMGHYHGFDGFETFSKKKGVFLQSRWTPLGLLRPPYGPVARRLLRFIVGA
ncbi:MAG TPA: coniferyl aldehyde dehydrogenase [Bryobacteraceae bacterium]|nr:coniferyl aldehyde dehydrogenase [Bryobacteraceae bacterium]